ncbi:hypothetical protein PM082_012593 [Marasmius tenuissimus]|nr:hypothetical protein PM082_012593 [Marasmius tenuissimus]
MKPVLRSTGLAPSRIQSGLSYLTAIAGFNECSVDPALINPDEKPKRGGTGCSFSLVPPPLDLRSMVGGSNFLVEGGRIAKPSAHPFYGPSWLHLPGLTICFLGVQIAWSVEMSNVSPYLLSLGLSKSAMALVFLAGPLSGLLVQPIIGVVADNSTSKWGRRRPYMIIGAIICGGSLLLLGWAEMVAGWFLQNRSSLAIFFAVFSVYVIDFSINAVQAMDRALIVDSLPPSGQPAGHAWAAKMLAIGSVIGFFVGELELPRILPFLGSTQIQILSILSSFILLFSHLLTAVAVREEILAEKRQSRTAGLIQKFVYDMKEIWDTVWTLPRTIKQICIIQFFSSTGWFPLLFFTSVYMSDLNKRAFYIQLKASGVNLTDAGVLTQISSLDEDSSRLGSRALFYSSLITLFFNWIIPYFVAPSGSDAVEGSASTGFLRIPDRIKMHLSTLWALSHLVFALCMLGTFFTTSVSGASTLIAITGSSWAVALWAPSALLGEAILTDPSLTRCTGEDGIQLTATPHLEDGRASITCIASSESAGDVELENAHDRGRGVEKENTELYSQGANDGEYPKDQEDLDESETTGLVQTLGTLNEEEGLLGTESRTLSNKAGIIFGIQNIFIVIPQFLVTGISSVIFAILDPSRNVLHHNSEPPTDSGGLDANDFRVVNATLSRLLLIRGGEEDVDLAEQLSRLELTAKSNSVVYIFWLGGIAAFIAFVICWRLSRNLQRER